MIGFGPVLVRIAREAHVDPAGSAFWRVTLASPLLWVLAARGRSAGAKIGPTAIAALAGFLFAGDLVCWHYGIRYTAIAKATVLSNMTPILVTAAAWFMLREAPRPVFVLGMLLGVGGSALMALARGGAGVDPPLGDAFSAAAAVWYALYILVVRQARQTMSAGVLMLWSSLVGAPLLLACAMTLGERLFPDSALGWAALAGLGVMHVAGQGSIAWALGRLPAPLAALVVLVQPVVAGLAAWMAFGERMTPLQALGAGV
jgi:drug/metabolite transporter (DMT)-like permease